MDRIKLEKILTLADLRNRNRPGSPQRQLAVDRPVIGATDRCWCGEKLGHAHE